ncbi:cupin domain-containing protein [Nostoc sp. FACHB-152]|nr:cupin domain-containing protein [Nostoc sp. FACHB-152]MBD2472744.1 cupin domain-containing protein [Nostoc sp. FACHB-145]
MTILESGQAYAKIRFDLPPHAKGSPLHYHTRMSETFTVLEGFLEMEFAQQGNRKTLYAGESLHIPAGVHHSFHNPSNDWVAFTTENSPATGFEQFIRGMYGLAIDGQVNHEGMPTNLLHLALLLKKADLVIVGIPLFLQTLLINLLLRLAQAMKTERSLAKYWNQGAK